MADDVKAQLVAAVEAGIAYCDALGAAQAQPGRMSDFQTVEGESLDDLFEAWASRSRSSLAAAKAERRKE